MIVDRDPGDETGEAWGWTRSAERIALEDAMIHARVDHIIALLGGVGLPSQRILTRQKRLQQAQRQHHQGRAA